MVRLKAIRESYGISQVALADKLGVQPSAVSNWEKEIRQMDYDTLFKISKMFNAPIDYIIGNDIDTKHLEDWEIKVLSWLRGLPENDRDFIIKIIETYIDHKK